MKNEIIAITKSNSSTLTMGTREIAELLGKEHSNIKISAERLYASGILTLALQESTYTNDRGRVYTEYRLNKRDSLVLVAQNCPEFTAAIVDRWQELEVQTPAIPQTYAAALLEAGRLALELEQAKPAVEFVERYVESDGLMNFRAAAKLFKRNERDLRAFLVSHGWMYQSGRNWVPYAPHLNKGHFEMKVGEANGFGYQVAYFTPRGIEALGAALAQHG